MVVVVTVVLVVVTIFPRKIVSRGVLFVVLVSKNYVCVLSKIFVSLFVRGRKNGKERGEAEGLVCDLRVLERAFSLLFFKRELTSLRV